MESLQWLRQRVLDAAEHQIPLRLRGSGSKDFYGEAARGELLDVSVHQGIVRYEPTELVITAKAGTPLSQIEQTLAEHRQMLAFEPPHFGPKATIGGMVAAGLSGPRRASSGAVRDFVLGLSLMDAKGQVLRFGGEVMKNVAGYDLSRLNVGALGTLGLIVDVSIKVWPMPAASETIWLAMDAANAIEHVNRWAAEPWPLTASAWVDGHLILRLEGAQAAVAQAAKHWQQQDQAKFLSVEQASRFWDDLKEHRLAFFGAVRQSSKALWRMSLPSATAH
ncbi:MAG: glycolate oxidase subunit GlcE, partial [Betaproteobacteria bacterium]|nr:glycolate oxidase subunit GlcE [Betaproteobacteria bacterium]